MSDLERLLAERNSALIALDMDWAAKMMPQVSSDAVRLMAMHKARYDCTAIPEALRHESRKWLQERGFKRWDHSDFLPEDQLP